MDNMQLPTFLQNHDEDAVHEEIFELIPNEYDKSEGQHFWNFTRPTARIVSQMRGFDLPEAIKLIWPRFSHDEYLDYHAERDYIYRKEAQHSEGEITFTGTAGTVIPAGYTVSTEAKNDIASKDYETTVECTIGEDGTVTVPARAVVAGKDGNTASNTIVVNTSSYDDVTSVTNSTAFTGGVDEEDDESLYARLNEYNKMQGDRGTGNPSDYKRWAESVPGTGSATVIRPTDNSGLVTIVLTDGNDEPASTELCEAVYNYIMSPDNDYDRLAPCGAFLKVIPPDTLIISVSGTLELTSGNIETVTSTFIEKIKEYFQEALIRGEVLYHKICNILGDIEGVYDFSGLTVNGGTSNIQLSNGVFPFINSENVTFTLKE